jgi:adenylosuccinate synthase
MLNGVTQLVMTKIDILNVFPEIEAVTAYEYDGQITEEVPYEMQDDLRTHSTSYEGWECSLADVTCFKELPKAAAAYIQALEQHLGVPITMVSTGPDRKELITRSSVRVGLG